VARFCVCALTNRSYDTASGAITRVPRLMGRAEKSLERFVASPDGRWLAFTGNDGYVILASARTKQWAAEFKLNGTARALAFTPVGGGRSFRAGVGVLVGSFMRAEDWCVRLHPTPGTRGCRVFVRSTGAVW
jgi:hypothetical protein